MFERVFGQRHLQSVGDLAHRRGVDAAGRGHRARNRAPDGIDQLLHLFAVLVRHPVENVGFHGALVLAGRRTEYLDLQIELVEQPLVEHQVHRKSRPVHAAFGLHIDPVGRRGEVIVPARRLRCRPHELAALLLEVEDRRTQLLQHGHRDRTLPVGPDIDSLDAGIALGSIDRTQRLEQRRGAASVAEIDAMKGSAGQRIGRRGSVMILRKVDPEDRRRG